ncbi:MAG: hypothetical protein ACKO2L_13010 [Planctomycetaceae bacterium]
MSQDSHNPYSSSGNSPETAPRMRGKVFNPASPVANRIAQNMTRRERRAVGLRMGLFGAWIGISFAVPFSQLLAQIHKGQFFGLTSAICGLLMAAFALSVPFLMRKQSVYLCQTQWARQQGIQPKDL